MGHPCDRGKEVVHPIPLDAQTETRDGGRASTLLRLFHTEIRIVTRLESSPIGCLFKIAHL